MKTLEIFLKNQKDFSEKFWDQDIPEPEKRKYKLEQDKLLNAMDIEELQELIARTKNPQAAKKYEAILHRKQTNFSPFGSTKSDNKRVLVG